MSLAINLAAFYRLDGNLADASGNGRDLTDAGATYGAGLIGQCLTGNGGSKSAWASGVNWRTSLWSAQAWFFIDGAGKDGIGGSVALTIGGVTIFSLRALGNGGDPGGLLVCDAGNFGSQNRPVSDGWNQAALTWDGSTGRFYVNATLTDTFSATVTTSTAAGLFELSATGDFDNSTDLVGVWLDRALTGGDVTESFNAGAGVDPTAAAGRLLGLRRRAFA